MSKHSDRHKKRYMIRAAEKAAHQIECSAESIEWIQASEDSGDAPKRFKMRAYTGGPMQVGYYGAPVVIDMAGLTAKAPLPILMNHSLDKLVGHADEITTSDTTLDLAGVVSGASPEAAQVLASSKQGFPWKASVGARPDKMEFVGEGVSTKVNGKSFTGPLYVARKATLGEVSFVAMAADGKTSAKVAAIAAFSEREITMDFDKWLEAKGFSTESLTADSKAYLQAQFDAEQKPDPKTKETKAVESSPADLLRAQAAAEAERIAAIDVLCKDHPAIKARAIKENLTLDQTKIAVLEARVPIAPPVTGSRRDDEPAIVEAALCMAGGLHGMETAYKPEVLEAAHAYRRHEGTSLQSLILAAAATNGYTGSRRIHRGNYDEVMRAAFIQAVGVSTHSLTTLLSTVGNKFLLEGFTSVEQVWSQLAATRSVSDFKTITSYRMLDDMVFEKIGAGGEIKHGTVSQESYTNRANTYAKMFVLTREDIINDDLGAFDTIRSRIGRGSGLKLNQIFWAAFLDDAAFFSTGEGSHKNLLTTALGESGISAANVLLKAQTDGYGNPLSLGGRHLLLTGATLAPVAKRWYVSQEVRDNTANTKTPTTNIYYNQFVPVESAYITSTTAWYLLPISGGDMAPMEVAFLDGVQSPTIESADADFNTLGVQFRGYFDFGVAKKEWRASVKSTGAG